MVSGGDYQVSGNQFHTSWSEVLGDEKAKNDNELLPRLQGKGKPGLYFLKTVVHHPSSISEELPAAGGAFPGRTPRPLICLIYWSATRERKAKTKNTGYCCPQNGTMLLGTESSEMLEFWVMWIKPK
jgi:hypothetical protein